MLKYLIFSNPGEVSVSEIKTFGMSIKQDNAIGFFGTGLKYAIAISCRLGAPIDIISGKTRYTFGVMKEVVREKEFNFIDMYGLDYVDDHVNIHASERLAFTTHVGAKWEPWMCIRECLTNCLDEGGTWEYSNDLPKPEQGMTHVIMSGIFTSIDKSEFAIPFDTTKVCDEHKPLSNDDVEVYDTPSNYIYYRGIRISTEKRNYSYMYNIKKHNPLGEDRIMASYWIGDTICDAVMASDNEKLIRCILQADESVGEGHFTYYPGSAASNASDVTKALMRTLFKKDAPLTGWGKEAAKLFLTDEDAVELLTPASLNRDERRAFDDAIERVQSYFDVSIYKIIIVAMNDDLLGKAYPKLKTIALNCNKLGSENPDDIVETLLEEYLHLRFDCGDYGRAWQDGALRMMLELMQKYERAERE